MRRCSRRFDRSWKKTYGRPSVVHKALPVPKYAYNPTRAQYHAAAILKRVETLRDAKWDAALGIVDADLFVPEVPFIFGEADRSTRSAIISLTRLRSESGTTESKREALNRRLVGESIHQIGMIRGLAHCPNNRCVMFSRRRSGYGQKRPVFLCQLSQATYRRERRHLRPPQPVATPSIASASNLTNGLRP